MLFAPYTFERQRRFFLNKSLALTIRCVSTVGGNRRNYASALVIQHVILWIVQRKRRGTHGTKIFPIKFNMGQWMEVRVPRGNHTANVNQKGGRPQRRFFETKS